MGSSLFREQNKKNTQTSLREKVLSDLQPVSKSKPKPSRVHLKTRFSYNEEIKSEPYGKQSGIIKWDIY